MKRLIISLLGCLLWASWAMPSYGDQGDLSKTVSSPTPFVNGVYRALIIGNNEYKDPEELWVPLKTPIADAEVIASVLQKTYGFSPENVTLLKNASRSQILSAFSELGKISQENDSVFIYYAGHGYSNPDTKEAFWIPVDAVGKEDYTYVRNSTIKSKLTVIADHAKHVFLVSDSCFSGTLLREGHRGIRPTDKNERYYKKVARKKSVQILAAGGLEYVDDDYKGTGHSPFTYFFLKQLEQNTERYYSATELSFEVTKAVSKNVFQTPEKGVLHGAGDNNGDFFFFNAPAASATDDSTKKSTPAATKAETFDAEAEMWALVKDSSNIDDIKAFLASFPGGRLSPVAKLKLQQLERVQKRGSQPQQKEKQQLASLQRPAVSKPGLKLAIFPGSFQNFGERAQVKVLKGLGEMIVKSDLFGEVLSSYPLGKAKNIKRLSDDLKTKELWQKKGLFSHPEPDLDMVSQEAKQLGVDAVIMYYLNVPKGSDAKLTIYFIDVAKKKQHKAKGSVQFWKFDGKAKTKKLTKKILSKFKKDNPR